MAVQDDWRGVDFPKDGREVLLHLDLSVPAYWDSDMGCWVLSAPLTIETVYRPYAWKPMVRKLALPAADDRYDSP